MLSRSSTVFAFALLLFIASVRESIACLCQNSQPNTVAHHLEEYAVAMKVWIGQEITPEEPPCPAGVFCPGLAYRNRYFEAVVDAVFKGDSGSQGKIVLMDRGFCGAGIQAQTNMLLFGSVADMMVEGYFGEIPVFTPASCALNQDWDMITAEDQTSIWDFTDSNP